jgi:hypothetical protein
MTREPEEPLCEIAWGRPARSLRVFADGLDASDQDALCGRMREATEGLESTAELYVRLGERFDDLAVEVARAADGPEPAVLEVFVGA